MGVPLIQGVYRYAHKIDNLNDNYEKSNAEGAVFAAAILPRLNACNPVAAEIVYSNMKVGATSTSLSVVNQVQSLQKSLGVIPCVKQIDTLAAEFPAQINYLYMTYAGNADDVMESPHPSASPELSKGKTIERSKSIDAFNIRTVSSSHSIAAQSLVERKERGVM
eukprot:12203684-Ditylum_brightwellii.AAC.1